MQRPNPECARCWFRLHPAPLLSSAEHEAIEIAEKAREARLEDLSRLNPVVVGLLGCGEAKLPGRHPARSLYKSNLFQASLEYLESLCHETYIVSAKHGLVELDRMIDSYQQRLPRRREDLQCWARNVECSLRLRFVKDHDILPVKLVVLAGREYIDPIADILGWAVDWELPLDGMTIFERQHWLAQWRLQHRRRTG